MSRNNGRRGRGRRRANRGGRAPNQNRADRNDDWFDDMTSDSDDDIDIFAGLQLIGALKKMGRRQGPYDDWFTGSGSRLDGSVDKAKVLYTEDRIPVNTVYASFKQHPEPLTEEWVRDIFAVFGPVKSVRIHTTANSNPYDNGDEAAANTGVARGRGRRYQPRQERINRYGFVSFESCEDAAKCILQKYKLRATCYIAKADSWHQEAFEKKQAETEAAANGIAGLSTSSVADAAASTSGKNDTSSSATSGGSSESSASGEPGAMNILHLNDDCLIAIFGELDLTDLLTLKKTCTRFEVITYDILKRYKFFDFEMLFAKKPYLTMLDAKNVLTELGSFVEHLSISQDTFNKPGTRILNLIPRHCPNLKQLEIQDFLLKVTALKVLGSVFKKLEGLSMISCGITDNVEQSLAQAKNLQRLDLSSNSEITGKCLKVVKNLKRLNLEGCQNIQGKPFSVFTEHNKTLEYLNIHCCSRLTTDAIKALAANLTELTHLVVNNSYDNVDPSAMALIAKLPKLKKLQFKINGYAPIDHILKSLAGTNQLEHLDLSDGIFTQVDYSLLCGLSNLKELKLNYKLDLSDAHMSKLATKTNFTELHIAGCTSVTDDALIEFISKNPQLRLLDVSYCQITEKLVFSAIDILKEQTNAIAGGGVARANRQLRLVVGQTNICPVIQDNALIRNNRHLLEISFSSTEGCYGAMDHDDYDDIMDDDDEDFMGYDYEDDDSDLWGGLDYDSDLGNFAEMCQYFYDSDEDDFKFQYHHFM